MNESGFTRIFRHAWLAVALILAACSGGPAQEPPLKGATLGGPFTLTDQNGRTVKDSDFAGRYRIIYFGYSFCPDICPTDLQTIGRAFSRFEQEAPQRAARVQPIFITVDPARDTPPILKKYVANFHPRLIGLTGTPQQVDAVRKAFGISANIPEGQTKDYLVDHARFTTLFGPDGQPIVFLPADEGVEPVVKALDQWVK